MAVCLALGGTMTRKGVVWNGMAAGLLLVVLALAARADREAPWRRYQEEYVRLIAGDTAKAANKKIASADVIRPHEISVASLGLVDRCTTCHLGMEAEAPSFNKAPFRQHPNENDLIRSHPITQMGCTPCHGGQGRRLHPQSTHAPRTAGGWSAFVKAQIRCARCHPSAGLPGTEMVAKGVDLYLEYACSGCHQPGRPGPGIGPDLAAVGLRGSDYLREVLLFPDRVYPDTIMPPLRFSLEEKGNQLEALLAYLQTLEPWPQGQKRIEKRYDPQWCTKCHRSGEAPSGTPHRCSYLRREASWLTCKVCHGLRSTITNIPVPPVVQGADPQIVQELTKQLHGLSRPIQIRDPTGSCPHLQEALAVCGVCHHRGEV